MKQETIVSLEGDDLDAMISEVGRYLNQGDDKTWVITDVVARLDLIDISGSKPQWLPGRWRATLTAQKLGA